MKLGELRSAIRARKSHVTITFDGMVVSVQKTSLLSALGEKFDSKGAETGLELTDAGHLVSTQAAFEREAVRSVSDPSPPYLADDLDEPQQLDIEDAIEAKAAAFDYDDLI